jgi:leader peptidase (prepilin peptidase)/N-methyltransferase
LTPAFYSAVAAGLYLFAHWPQLGGFVAPSAALLAALILIALFDAVYFVIPDGPVWFLAATGLGVSLLADPAGTPERLAAAAAGYASLRAVAWGYERWRGVAGVGEGDARLFAIAGLWVGFRGLPGCMIFAVVSALLSAAILMRAGGLRDARDAMPFGPHLALGLWLVWAVGPVELG